MDRKNNVRKCIFRSAYCSVILKAVLTFNQFYCESGKETGPGDESGADKKLVRSKEIYCGATCFEEMRLGIYAPP